MGAGCSGSTGWELLSRIGLLGSIPELDNQLKGLDQIYSRGGAGLIGRLSQLLFQPLGSLHRLNV